MNSQEMQNRIAALEDKVSEMSSRLHKLEQTTASKFKPDEVTEYGGALFQKKFGGGYREAIFCLVCNSPDFPMTPTASKTHFQCVRCGHAASFPGKNIRDIIKDLPKSN